MYFGKTGSVYSKIVGSSPTFSSIYAKIAKLVKAQLCESCYSIQENTFKLFPNLLEWAKAGILIFITNNQNQEIPTPLPNI